MEDESEGDVVEEYRQVGKLRCQERIPLSQLIWGLLLTRRTLWQFVEAQAWDKEHTLDLEILVVRFFDRAILHAVTGYEIEAGGPSTSRHADETAFWPGG